MSKIYATTSASRPTVVEIVKSGRLPGVFISCHKECVSIWKDESPRLFALLSKYRGEKPAKAARS